MKVEVTKIASVLVDPDTQWYDSTYRLKDTETGMSRAFNDRVEMANGIYDMPDDLFDFNSPRVLDREIW